MTSSNNQTFVKVSNADIYGKLEGVARKVDYLLLSNAAIWVVLAILAKKVFLG